VLNLDKGEAVTNTAGAERAAETQTVVMPADWLGDTVQTYLGFISEDSKEVANSVYMGSVVLA
jgi:hypothetical protein